MNFHDKSSEIAKDGDITNTKTPLVKNSEYCSPILRKKPKRRRKRKRFQDAKSNLSPNFHGEKELTKKQKKKSKKRHPIFRRKKGSKPYTSTILGNSLIFQKKCK